MTDKQLWDTYLKEIKGQLNQPSYKSWFESQELIKIENNKIYVKVPLEIHKKILNQNYVTLIQDTLFNITKENYEVEYLLQSELEAIKAKEKPKKPKIIKEIEESDSEEMDNIPNIVEEEIEEEKTTKPKKTTKKDDEPWESNLIPSLNFDNFIVGNSNRIAKTIAMDIAQNPGNTHNPLFIYGKSGIGKTHLMHAIGNYITEHSNKKVLYTTSEIFKDDYVKIMSSSGNNIDKAVDFKKKYRELDVLIIDDIQYLVGAEKTQQEFFHTFNDLRQAGKQMIISSDRSPNDLTLLEDRLRSRFLWGLSVDIYPPDFELRINIIKSKLKNLNYANKIDDEVIDYIANSCTNDVRFIEGTINRLMAYTAMIVPDKIDIKFANEALADFVDHNIYSDNSIESIQRAVAQHYGLTVEDLKGKRRMSKVANARQVGMYLSRELTQENLSRIGLEFGGRDHSTVIHACEKVEKDLKKDNKLQEDLKAIKMMI